MNCLIDAILIEGIPVKKHPNSGLHINKELTIPLKNLEGFASSSQKDLEKLWDEVQVKAFRKFEIRLKLGMLEMFGACSDKVTSQWVCLYAEHLLMPWMYFLGAELMTELSHTDRVNRFTTIDRPRAYEMQEEFTTEFQLQLKAALHTINDAGAKKQELPSTFHYVEIIP